MFEKDQLIFSEVVKVKDGVFYNLAGHAARMDRTCRHFFNHPLGFELGPGGLPAPPQVGLIKCRLVYGEQIQSVEYSVYNFRRIKSLALVRADEIDYSFKYVDRQALQQRSKTVTADDILMVQGDNITDTSLANVVFQGPMGFVTPTTYLLPGTKREMLLRQGRIAEAPITVADLDKYDRIYLINAMMDLEDEVSIPISAVDRSQG